MPERSAITLLGILQRHGLSVAFLEAWVGFCERRQSGVFLIHHHEGRMELLDAYFRCVMAEVGNEDLTGAIILQ